MVVAAFGTDHNVVDAVAVLALTPAAVEPPQVTAVSGNDGFSDAWNISVAPFIGEQSTEAATVESLNTGFLSPKASAPVAGAGSGLPSAATVSAREPETPLTNESCSEG